MIPQLHLTRKLCIIISNNKIIYKALRDNIPHNFNIDLDICNQQFIASVCKIDLLIIDHDINAKNIPLYKVNYVVNFTDHKVSDEEIRMSKPFKLNNLLDIIELNTSYTDIFCCINNNWIYSQKASKLTSQLEEISLTDKENKIFVSLLTSKGFTTTKNELQNNVWRYHKDTESKTIETHLYNLKKKLPLNLLEIENTECILRVNQIA